MAFMIYRKGRFRKKTNNFLILIIINHAVWKKWKIQILGKQKNRATKLFYCCWDITPKRHLSKEMGFHWYSCQMRHFVSVHFYPTKAWYFFSIHHESTHKFSIKRWEIRFKEIIISKIFFGQKLSKDKTISDSLESCFLKLLSQIQLSP